MEEIKMMNNFMNGMFGKIGSGMCKLSMSGNIAVKTSNGYKSYNVNPASSQTVAISCFLE